jgi:hypothetical protein
MHLFMHHGHRHHRKGPPQPGADLPFREGPGQ